MKQRFWLIVGAILFILFIVVVAAASNTSTNQSSTQYRPDPKYKATITADTVGLDFIVITNENIPAQKIVLPQALPYTMNFAKDDILTFTVHTKDGYRFNSFDLGDGTFRSDNPMATKPNKNFQIHACVMPEDVIPWDITQ